MAIDRSKVLAAAQKYMRKSQWDKALKEYRLLVDDDPEDVRSLLKCGDLYVKLDRYPEALVSYETVADHYARGDMYEKAVAVYKQALRLDNEEVRLHQALGEAYHRLGRLKDAVRSFYQAQAIYKERGDSKAQREILEYMVRIDAEDVGLRVQLAERYAKDDLIDRAVDIFLICAEVLEREGRLDEFVQVVERIIFLDPERHDLRKKIVRIYLNREDNKQALKHLQICFKVLPADIEVLELLGQTFERLQRGEKAVLVYEKLAQLYEQRGRQALVKDVYRRIIRLDPANDDAKRVLGIGRLSSVEDSDVFAGPMDTDSLPSVTQTPGAETSDALDGIEFLDGVEFLDEDSIAKPVRVSAQGQPAVYELDRDDFAEEPGPVASAPVAPPRSSRPAPALEVFSPSTDLLSDSEIVDLSDDIVFLDDPSHAMIVEDHLVRPAAVSIELEPIEGELTEAEVARLLTEFHVFLKYGLYDKASMLISSTIAQAPNSLYAHEQMLALNRAMHNADGVIADLLKLANLSAKTPYRCYEYLAQAMKVSPSPASIHSYARNLGIDLNSPPPIAEGLDEISFSDLDELEPLAAEQAPLDDHFLEDDLFLSDESSVAGIIAPAPEPAAPSAGVPIGIEHVSFAHGDFEDLEELAEMRALPPIYSGDELSADDTDLVDVDLGGITDAEFVALPTPPPDEAILEEISSDEVLDALFEDVFTNANLKSLSHQALTGTNASTRQGLSQEASANLAASHPAHPQSQGSSKGRERFATLRQGFQIKDNPFGGARSLSQKFNPQALSEQRPRSELVPNFSSAINSNLELGNSYRDIGLYEKAIEEFCQALDDPDSGLTAGYHIALCELELGRMAEAKIRLHGLLQDDKLTIEIRQIVESKLRQLA